MKFTTLIMFPVPLFIAMLSIMQSALVRGADNYTPQREAMVRTQIEARGVRDQRVLETMRTVARHQFIPEYLWASAYADNPLPIGNGQSISQPYIVALMTELLQVDSAHRVLEIGTGSGYQAAVLSSLASEVFTIEIVEELGRTARETLERLGYENVEVRIGDGYLGWPQCAPFDRIIVTAAPEEIPAALVAQLQPGGRMVLPVGPRFGVQELLILEKDVAGDITTEETIAVRFVPMVPGEATNR